ncbi:hypothetical protein QBC40DRAFT_278974 [Triangularia verruculosa]|uniref:NADH:flavin oxidoreductase/NADH oxidase N-terminal domain-containing protein n=1 Tax=Triangularia verruculosa TaxID=2587418 RepID=A0AAN7AWH6_9PEZI|nr:hypothetical protein QBC40DRAFT_278974 [Triangularia verruculosa]
MSDSKLFKPLQLNPSIKLKHRIALAPLTRFRSTDEHVPIVPLMKEYYSQRGSAPGGTLLVTEGTFISPTAGGMGNVPGIWSQEQIAAWKEIVDGVHAQGSFIYLQLWALGRAALGDVAKKEGFTVKAPSAIAIPDTEGAVTPEEMTIDDIKQKVAEYAQAAKNAIEAGFDGVEIHGANGYLVDQFIQSNSNQRTDEYGGSIENRSRFAIEVVDAVTAAVGEEKVGLRLNFWSTFQGMKMKDPVPQFSDVIRKISERHPKMSYLHLVESRTAENKDEPGKSAESLDFALDIWKGPVLIAGGLTAKGAKKLVDEEHKERDNIVAVFGRYFISTPDLVFRIREGIELNEYDRNTFYIPMSPKGYIDQPFSKEFEKVYGQGVKALN